MKYAISALFAIAVATAVVTGCTAPSAALNSVPVASNAAQPREVASRSHGRSLNYSYVFITVDTGLSKVNKVMGINELGHVVGTYGTGKRRDRYGGFSAHYPYVQVHTFFYPNSNDTLGLGVTSNLTTVGAVVGPRSLKGTWGFIIYKGIWTITRDHGDGKDGTSGITEFTGATNQGLVTGFYVDPASGNDVPFEFNATTNRFITLEPDSRAVSAVASDLNARGDMVGYETLKDGRTVGWIFRNSNYYQIAVPGAKSTIARGLDFDDQVVGSYVDKHGNTHGFLVSDPLKDPQWQYPLDDPSASGTTVITALNNYDTITGWYVDVAGITHGFVATTTR